MGQIRSETDVELREAPSGVLQHERTGVGTTAQQDDPELRRDPPWIDTSYIRAFAPTLRVGYADGWWIIRGRGGEIVGSTRSDEQILQLIRLESNNGFGAVELHLRGEAAHGCHGLANRLRPVVGRVNPGSKAQALSLEDLGL